MQKVITSLLSQPPCPSPGVAIWLARAGTALAQFWLGPQEELQEEGKMCWGSDGCGRQCLAGWKALLGVPFLLEGPVGANCLHGPYTHTSRKVTGCQLSSVLPHFPRSLLRDSKACHVARLNNPNVTGALMVSLGKAPNS